MAALPEPYIPDVNRTLANYNTGYALGQDQRKQNALSEAGQFMAKNDQTGARNALYNAGQMSEGLQIDDRMRAAARQAKDEQLAKAKRSNDILGNMALLADTPEKWAVVIGNAKRAGLQVDNWADFGTRDFVLAQGGKVREFLDLELKERALAAKQAAAGAGIPGSGKLGQGERWRMKGGQLDLDASGRPVAEPIPGSSKEAVPAEVAARIGLADKFISEKPQIRKDIEGGELGTSFGFKTDLGLDLDFNLGRGKAGALYRQIEDGSEALVRNLTGAGMNKEEAESYARRFLPGRLDRRETVLQKLDGLNKSLAAVKRSVMTGRGIASIDQIEPDPAAAANTPLPPGGFIATKKGAPGAQAAPVKVTTPEEAMKLPSGTSFVTPDGRVKVRP